MNVRIHRSAEDVASAVAHDVAGAIARKPALSLGLPAGRTPIPLFRELVSVTRTRPLDWSRIRTFNLDEFITPTADGPQPFAQFMHDHLLSRVPVAPDYVNALNGRAADFQAECDRYERAIASAGGLDLMLLGIGANGHIGFNEPGTPMDSRTHIATLTPASRAANAWLFGNQIESVPARALTMGLATILGARAIILVAMGEAKAAAVAAMRYGAVTSALPASLLQTHADVTIVLDEAAAGSAAPIK